MVSQKGSRMEIRKATMDDLEEMEDAIEKKADWQYFEERYEGFTLTEATFTRNNINRGCYVNIEMRRRR